MAPACVFFFLNLYYTWEFVNDVQIFCDLQMGRGVCVSDYLCLCVLSI